MTLAGNDESRTARTLLDCVPALRRPCDLDLLVFFARHWRSLLSSEQLAQLLGYPLREIAQSRDGLVAGGLLTRAQGSSRSERMYVFDPDSLNGGPLPDIVAAASTPAGRLSLRRSLMGVNGGKDDLPADDRPPPDGVTVRRSRSRERRPSQPERTQ